MNTVLHLPSKSNYHPRNNHFVPEVCDSFHMFMFMCVYSLKVIHRSVTYAFHLTLSHRLY